MKNNKLANSENRSWTSTPGWSGYVYHEDHESHQQQGTWTCTPGWCGYVYHDEK